ncbi:DUF2591 domain-containing protein [Burkholderia sp. 22PA0106]|uniref:DUF2591 domain-containing protein n=1 Tax=Burkholderia sp. 22PA0106 TaxID=3237371 RepID=UPI0039C4C800
MQTDRLDARELDYWTLRALAHDDRPLVFVATEPQIVATVASGDFSRMDQRVSASTDWADAAAVLERVADLRATRLDDGVTRVEARFAGLPDLTLAAHGEGPTLRVALLRAFVRARFGDTVGPVPGEPHVVQNGQVTAHQAGAPLPHGGQRRDAPRDTHEIGALPRP